MKNTKRTLQLLSTLGTIFIIASVVFFWMAYTYYFKWIGLFNSEGRYFDDKECVVYLSQDSALIVPAIVFILLALFMFHARRKYMETHIVSNELIKAIRHPWVLLDCKDRNEVQNELKLEIGSSHVLWKQNPIAIARSNASDDILVKIKKCRTAYVHLTYSGHIDQYPDKFPDTVVFNNELEAVSWLSKEINNHEN